MKLSKIMISYCIFALFISLFLGAYTAGVKAYGITSGTDIGSDLDDLNLIQSMQTMAEGMHQITNPGSFLDIIGGLLSLAIGVIKGLTAVLSTPLEIMTIISGTYANIPSILWAFVGTTMYIILGFILVKAYTGQEH